MDDALIRISFARLWMRWLSAGFILIKVFFLSYWNSVGLLFLLQKEKGLNSNKIQSCYRVYTCATFVVGHIYGISAARRHFDVHLTAQRSRVKEIKVNHSLQNPFATYQKVFSDGNISEINTCQAIGYVASRKGWAALWYIAHVSRQREVKSGDKLQSQKQPRTPCFCGVSHGYTRSVYSPALTSCDRSTKVAININM